MSRVLNRAPLATGLFFALAPSATASKVECGFDQSGGSSYSSAKSNLEALAELDRVALEASTENWDGRGSPAVSTETVALARKFVEAIPPGFPEPDVFADTDGDIRMEWFDDSEWTFEVSLNEGGGVSYACRFACSRQNGSVRFGGEWPPELQVNLVRFASRRRPCAS